MFQEIRLGINLSKTETLIWSWNESSTGIYPESIMKIQDVKLVNAKHLKYINGLISYNKFGIQGKENEHRVGQ